MKLYTLEELEAKNRTELWTICDSLKLPRRRSTKDCIEEILAAMPEPVECCDVQTQVDDDDALRAQMNAQGYRDALEGLPQQVDHSSYRAGYARAMRDMVILPDGANIEKAEVEAVTVVWRTDLSGFATHDGQTSYFQVNSLHAEKLRVDCRNEVIREAVLAAIPAHKQALRDGSFVSADPRERGYTIKEIQAIHKHPGFTWMYK